MKTCSACGRSLEVGAFYARCSQCKECICGKVRAYRLANIERVRAYDRQRSKQPHVRARIRRVTKEWREAHPDWRQAQTILGNAVRDGRIVRPWFCQRCGTLPRRIEAHHLDYSKPLEVEWLCKPCHAKADQERRAA